MSKKVIKKRNYVDADGNPVSELITEFEHTQQDVDDAYEEFNKQKNSMLDMMRRAGIDDDNVNDLRDRITTPEQLEFGKAVALTIVKGAEAHGGTRPSPSSPPGGSVVSLPNPGGKRWVYANAREAIDDLYLKLQVGTPEEKKFADRAISQYFQKLKPTLDAGKLGSFSMSACPSCGYALLKGTNKCPYCGLDIFRYRSRGGTLYDDPDIVR